ncbi:MAG: TonB-dependent receptor [Vicinamibacteria bacterium]|nr:TonB-dependent receptor [Vicinamibacteria bacterium]
MKLARLAFVATGLVLAANLAAQGNPTGNLSGTVADSGGLVLPGVTVTATSPALQGARTAVTSANGDFIIPFLPAGDYKVRFELQGFQAVERKVRVQLAETVVVDAKLAVGGISEEVTVVAEVPVDFTQTATAAASYKAAAIDQLPVARSINGAVLLAPGTTSTGPSGNVTFSGAMSYEGLFLLNGVVLNETLRNQASLVFIEDAIQETKTMTGNISAEYGRFAGGVASVITKSGGNEFSGSFRLTMDSDKWRSLTPFEEDLAEDPRSDKKVPTWEATLGGPIVKDKLWFFGATRLREDTDGAQTLYTNIVYDNIVDDKRYEGKLTWALDSKHTFKAGYTQRDREETNNSFGDIMDRASLYDSSQPEKLLSFNYTGVLSSNFFVEAQYASRRLSFIGSGSRYTDIERGTMILDRSRNSSRWNSPTFCAVCGLTDEQIAAGELNEEKRNNQNILVKGTYFLSTSGSGSHNLVFGFDAFEDSRENNNWQSGSGFRLNASDTIFRGETLYPVVRPGTSDRDTAASYILWTPIFEATQGSQLRTYSAFFNDVWRLNQNWSFNLGVRWDKTDEKDQAGNKVSDDQAFSPRLSATFDPKGDGKLAFRAGLARYVMPITSGIADLGSGAGRSASFQYVYRGPAINTNNPANPVSAADALRTVFDWFYANGGTNRALRSNPSYPGVNRKIADDLTTPTTWEYSLGLGGSIGTRGSYRLDAIYRDANDFFTDEVIPGRTAADPTGRLFDLNVVVNTNVLERKYKALMSQIQYRFTDDLTLGGNYTLSQANGNVNGETASSGPVQDDILAYAEYKDLSWNSPTGDLSIDQRHKLRLWANWERGLGKAGRIVLGVLQNLSSGTPSSTDATIDTRPYVTNPGYLTPDSTTSYYFGGRGDLVTDTITSTDLSINYYLPVGWMKNSQFFFRFVVDNLFDQAGRDSTGNETVFTASNQNAARTLKAFNPFTETPVYGTHYEYGPDFGEALSASDYQSPRSFYFAVGFRF